MRRRVPATSGSGSATSSSPGCPRSPGPPARPIPAHCGCRCWRLACRCGFPFRCILGGPGAGYPWRWAVVPWMAGSTPPRLGCGDVPLARDMAAFARALHGVDPAGGPVRPPTHEGAPAFRRAKTAATAARRSALWRPLWVRATATTTPRVSLKHCPALVSASRWAAHSERGRRGPRIRRPASVCHAVSCSLSSHSRSWTFGSAAQRFGEAWCSRS
jgi:hypothetical protein